MSTSLKKGLAYVFIANFINLGFNLITNFVLPKELSVESYATIKTFQLYVSYAGLFHFGFVDGMYLKYGGKNIKELRREDLGTNLSTLRLFEIVVTIVCAIIAIISKQEVLVFFSLSILPLNLANYFKQLYQATGEFSLYGKIMNANTILIFFANMIWITKKILTNILAALYKPFGFSCLLSFFALFFYLYAYYPSEAGKGWKAAIHTWFTAFKVYLMKLSLLFVIEIVHKM